MPARLVVDNPRPRPAAPPPEPNTPAGIWERSEAVGGWLAWHFFRRSTAVMETLSEHFRFSHGVWCNELREERPAVLAAIRDFHGYLNAVEVTFLARRTSGRLLPASLRRVVVGDPAGGTIAVWPGRHTGGTLLLAKTVEQARLISSSKPPYPVHSFVNQSNFERLRLSPRWSRPTLCGPAGSSPEAGIERLRAEYGQVCFAEACRPWQFRRLFSGEAG